MIAWLKRHWPLLLVGFIILFLLYGGIDGLISKITYRKQIREKDASISQLYQGIKDSKKREERLMNQANESYALAMEKEAKLRKKDREMMVKIHEKRELKKKIKAMPVTQVIVRTIEIIQCDEIQQQTQGIVFSLSCGKENLTFLEASLFLEKERDDWVGQYHTCLGEVSDLKNTIVSKDGVIKEVTGQSVKKDGIIANWKGKFNLSEKRGKRSYWKGFKTGGTVGGIVGGIIGFFLGK